MLDDLHREQECDAEVFDRLGEEIAASFDVDNLRQLPRGDLATKVRDMSVEFLVRDGVVLNRLEQRTLVTKLVNGLLANAETVGEASDETEVDTQGRTEPYEVADGLPMPPDDLDDLTYDLPPDILPEDISIEEIPDSHLPPELDPLVISNFSESSSLANGQSASPIEAAKLRVQPVLLERIDVATATQMPRADLARQVTEVVGEILFEERLRLNLAEQRDLVTKLINDMLGLGPLEPLLEDESITDIMVNGPDQVYIERKGKLVLTEVKFRDNQHVMNIATRIVSKIGRRVDKTLLS